jgi:hypothetical protein
VPAIEPGPNRLDVLVVEVAREVHLDERLVAHATTAAWRGAGTASRAAIRRS